MDSHDHECHRPSSIGSGSGRPHDLKAVDTIKPLGEIWAKEYYLELSGSIDEYGSFDRHGASRSVTPYQPCNNSHLQLPIFKSSSALPSPLSPAARPELSDSSTSPSLDAPRAFKPALDLSAPTSAGMPVLSGTTSRNAAVSAPRVNRARPTLERWANGSPTTCSVSYTHLTLPTKRIV